MIRVKTDTLARIFEEWKDRWDKNPDWFQTLPEFVNQPPKSYGEAAAIYFKELEKELFSNG